MLLSKDQPYKNTTQSKNCFSNIRTYYTLCLLSVEVNSCACTTAIEGWDRYHSD